MKFSVTYKNNRTNKIGKATVFAKDAKKAEELFRIKVPRFATVERVQVAK